VISRMCLSCGDRIAEKQRPQAAASLGKGHVPLLRLSFRSKSGNLAMFAAICDAFGVPGQSRLSAAIPRAAQSRPSVLGGTHQHDLGRFVEHRPHHLISAPRYRAAAVDLARLVLGAGQSKHRPD
jgi:hypothetical protein